MKKSLLLRILVIIAVSCIQTYLLYLAGHKYYLLLLQSILIYAGVKYLDTDSPK